MPFYYSNITLCNKKIAKTNYYKTCIKSNSYYPVGKIAKNFVNSVLKIQCHVVKNTFLQTPFSAILPTENSLIPTDNIIASIFDK